MQAILNNFTKSEAELKLTNDVNNPLLLAGANLIGAIIQLRRIQVLGDINVLRQNLINELVEFEAKAKALQVNTETMHNARYILCSCLDEMVLTRAQNRVGAVTTGSKWDTQSLLSLFYKDTWGGEKVFLLLEQFRANPSQNIDILELISLCLSLGFEGRYSVLESGRERLQELRNQLLEQIRIERGNLQQIFAPDQYDTAYLAPKKKRTLIITIIVTAAVMLSMLIVFNSLLTNQAQPVYKLLRQIV